MVDYEPRSHESTNIISSHLVLSRVSFSREMEFTDWRSKKNGQGFLETTFLKFKGRVSEANKALGSAHGSSSLKFPGQVRVHILARKVISTAPSSRGGALMCHGYRGIVHQIEKRGVVSGGGGDSEKSLGG